MLELKALRMCRVQKKAPEKLLNIHTAKGENLEEFFNINEAACDENKPFNLFRHAATIQERKPREKKNCEIDAINSSLPSGADLFLKTRQINHK